MKKLLILWIALLLPCLAMPVHAATISVTTPHDEANCRNETDCAAGAASMSFPNSNGCSLREAMQDVADAAQAFPTILAVKDLSFPECGVVPDAGPGTSNIIDLGGNSIAINSTEKDPNDSTGVNTVNNGLLPFIGDGSGNYGGLTIQNGTLSCFSDPKAMPNPIDGVTMLTIAAGGSLKVIGPGMTFQNCTTPSSGGAINNSAGGDLLVGDPTNPLSAVTFTNIRATNQGQGGCIDHGSGNLVVAYSSFTTCVVDNGALLPGGGGGQGGAIYIAGAGGSTKAAISFSTFQANVAGESGGAIYLSGTDSAAISFSTFQANVANGSTFSSGNSEFGGGAIYATGTAMGTNPEGNPNVNPSAFLIFQDNFALNTALQGTGGAILLTQGNLTSGTLTVNLGEYELGKIDGIPGGVVASNFTGNVAGGTWDTVDNGAVDPRAGSGGAIYADGNFSVYSSSFVKVANGNSASGSGGAIAYHDGGDNNNPALISNSTFNSNSAAANGGAIANITDKNTGMSGKMTLVNDTLAGNSTTLVSGGGNFYNANSNTLPFEVNIGNTIFSKGVSGGSDSNCGGQTFNDEGGNLQFSPASGCASIMNTGDPKLQGPSLFGGINALVEVMELGNDSAASGAGIQTAVSPALACANSPVDNLDEALNSRPMPVGTNCDSGAFEANLAPAWTITKTSTGSTWKVGSNGHVFTIGVSNSGSDKTNGTVTLTDDLPTNFTATAMSGTGWDCTGNAFPVTGGPAVTLTCTRIDSLASGTPYPNITLTVNVAPTASGSATNQATVSGGGAPDATATASITFSLGMPVTLQSFEVN